MIKVNNKIAALAVIVCVVVVATAIIYVVRSRQSSQAAQGGSELNGIDSQLNDLGNFLNFENQTFDYNLGDISGGWG